MPNRAFPLAKYVEGVVRLLDRIGYEDNNYTPESRLQALKAVHDATARHFAAPEQQDVIRSQIKKKKLAAVIRTSVQVSVYAWPKCSEAIQVALSIYFVYIVILDDSTQTPNGSMDSFASDLLKGRQPHHPFWKLMTPFLDQLLSHYGPFCSMAILRSTFDYFQGCWIETQQFSGWKGSNYFPLFLRRLNGLGGICGASLFPKKDVDEQEYIGEVTTAIAQVEPPVAFINDLFSFYKEWNDPRDEISLVTNIANVEGIAIEAVFERLVTETIRTSDQLLSLFDGCSSSRIRDTIHCFIRGYITWHIVDPRFRLKEVYAQALTVPDGAKFRQYIDRAFSVADPDIGAWAPTGSMITVETYGQSDNESESIFTN